MDEDGINDVDKIAERVLQILCSHSYLGDKCRQNGITKDRILKGILEGIKSGKGTCYGCMVLNSEWENLPEEYDYVENTFDPVPGAAGIEGFLEGKQYFQFGGKEAINMMSMLFCRFGGGIINAVDSGQSTVTQEDIFTDLEKTLLEKFGHFAYEEWNEDKKRCAGLLRHVLEGDVNGCIGLLEEIVMQGRELTQFVTDLTWYLRNLLLVKSSDNIEEVIDVSSDNLVRLREEAAMLEITAIMRYIRIFSELSGQIKYAAQKRILIEIALIRLCRPSMEQDYESVLERIRVMEEKLEKGVVVRNAGGFLEGQDRTEALPDPNPAKERPVLPKAIPEDVQAAVSKWPAIVGQTSMPMKLYLKDAKLSLGGDNKLTIVVEDGLASDYFLKQEGHKEILVQILSETVGKEIDVTIMSVPDQNTFVQNYVDLSQVIHMEIEEEE